MYKIKKEEHTFQAFFHPSIDSNHSFPRVSSVYLGIFRACGSLGFWGNLENMPREEKEKKRKMLMGVG